MTARVPCQWESEVNAALRALPKRWPNAHVIDWHDFANAHDDWFVADGFHLTTAGQGAYATLIASALGLLPKPTPPTPSGLDVVAFDAPLRSSRPVPLALAGGDVWIASGSRTGTASFVRLDRYGSTAQVLKTIEVPQEAVFGVAGDGGAIWVAGGGDGGVPDTTVSKVDVRTGAVLFTKTLTGTPCSCPIVAGRAGVWLVGNGTNEALHLSSTDGHVIAVVALPERVACVDGDELPAPRRARRRLGRDHRSRDEPHRRRRADAGDSIDRTGDRDGCADGRGERFRAGDRGIRHARRRQDVRGVRRPRRMREFLKMPFIPTAVADVGGLMWVFGGDRLEIQPTAGDVPSELAYDAARGKFDKVTDSPATQVQGFRDAIVDGEQLWVVYDAADGRHGPSIVVVKIPFVAEG